MSVFGFTSIYLYGLIQPAVRRLTSFRLWGSTVLLDLRDLWIILASMPAVCAMFIASSRVVDHMHSAADICWGAGMGAGIAALWYMRYFHPAFHPDPRIAGRPRSSVFPENYKATWCSC